MTITHRDRELFESRKADISETGFAVVPPPKGTRRGWLVRDRAKFNRWKPRRFASELEAVTFAWQAWEFKTGRRTDF